MGGVIARTQHPMLAFSPEMRLWPASTVDNLLPATQNRNAKSAIVDSFRKPARI